MNNPNPIPSPFSYLSLHVLNALPILLNIYSFIPTPESITENNNKFYC